MDQLREVNTLAIRRVKEMWDLLLDEQADRSHCLDDIALLQEDNHFLETKYEKAIGHYNTLKASYVDALQRIAILEQENATLEQENAESKDMWTVISKYVMAECVSMFVLSMCSRLVDVCAVPVCWCAHAGMFSGGFMWFECVLAIYAFGA